MTTVRVEIPEDVARVVAQTFPDKTMQQIVEHLLRQAIEQPASGMAKRGQSLVEQARRIRGSSLPTTNDEIRAIRDEGRP